MPDFVVLTVEGTRVALRIDTITEVWERRSGVPELTRIYTGAEIPHNAEESFDDVVAMLNVEACDEVTE